MREPADELIPTRASLLHRLKNWRDQASWQQFFDTYWRLIYDVARRSNLSDSEAQDVVQETMLAVAKHMPSFQYNPAIGQFKSWLLNLTRWRIIDQLRKRGRTASDSPPTHDSSVIQPIARIIDPASNALVNLWEAEWHKTLFTAALANVRRRVDPQNYQLFDFYVNKEWPPARVAATFHTSVDQVYLTKHRITEMLKTEVARLEREGS
jgi:RNA polymerase sigma-70 factor (ECF subfamily)